MCLPHATHSHTHTTHMDDDIGVDDDSSSSSSKQHRSAKEVLRMYEKLFAHVEIVWLYKSIFSTS